MRNHTNQKRKNRSVFLTNPILFDYYVRKEIYKTPKLNIKLPINKTKAAHKGLKKFLALCALLLATTSLIFSAERTTSMRYAADHDTGLVQLLGRPQGILFKPLKKANRPRIRSLAGHRSASQNL